MWKSFKSFICYYCEREGKHNEENNPLLKEGTSAALDKGYEFEKPDLKACMTNTSIPCSVSKFKDPNELQKGFQEGLQKIQINLCASETGDSGKNASSDIQGYELLTNNRHKPTKESLTMNNGDNLANSAKATTSVSGSIINANSPLWKQMENINSVYDDRPPTFY